MKAEIFDFQKKWIDAILDYINESNLLETSLIEQVISDVSKAYQEKNYIGMEFLYKDINDLYNELSEKDKEEINRILEVKFGYSFKEKKQEEFDKILKILKRNKLDNKDLLFVEKFVNDNFDVYDEKIINRLNILINEHY